MQIRKIEREEVFMNTIIHISLYSDQSTVYSQEKLQEAFKCFDGVVRKYTRFNSKSELAKLNNHSGKPFQVSLEFFNLIKYMLELSKITKGRYDPTIIDLLETYGYGKDMSFNELDNPGLFDKIQKLVESRPSPLEIKLNKKNLTVTLAPKQRIDLGSIGKGYAIDLAYDILSEFPSFMINAGGDIRVKGPKPDNSNWQIALYKAQLPNKSITKEISIGTIELKEGSICGSGGWARKVRFFHHLLNPKTGFPINEVSQTYVFAPTAKEADAWATVLFTLGSSGLTLLEKNNMSGIVIDDKGHIFQTKDIKKHN